MDDEYITQEQFNSGMRELATDLKGELLYRPADVTVTVDLGIGATGAVIMLCLAFVLYMLVRAFREDW